jgi:hypothetical protein
VESDAQGARAVIHYHGTPLTPAADMLKCFKGRHAMVSFEHPEQIEVAAEICQSVALDNGAFSAWKQRKPLDFDGYLQWAQKWLKHPAVDWCVIPDVIDGTEEQNEYKVWSWPIHPTRSVPVWHLHESLGYLDKLCHSFPRVALGSSGEYAEPGSEKWWARISEVMKVCCDKDGMPVTKLHGLRMLDPVIFSHIPFSSVDSCNVARNVGMTSRGMALTRRAAEP